MGIFRDRPKAQPDNVAGGLPGRAGRYGEAYVSALGAGKSHFLADEGSYFVAMNATDGTGIAGHAAPVQADTDTKALLHLYNGGQNRIYIDYVRLRVTAVGAGASTTDLVVYIDAKGATARSSGGTAITPVNVNTDASAYATGATVYFGPVVTAMSSSKKVFHQRVRSVVPVVEDQYTLVFGPTGGTFPAAQALSGTNIVSAYAHCPPVVIGPGGNFNLTEWGASQSGAHSFEFEVGYWER